MVVTLPFVLLLMDVWPLRRVPLDGSGIPNWRRRVAEKVPLLILGAVAIAAAGASGTVGPNLDDAKPSYELAVQRITLGQGGMPAFGDQLEPQQIADVAQFVVSSAGG